MSGIEIRFDIGTSINWIVGTDDDDDDGRLKLLVLNVLFRWFDIYIFFFQRNKL